MSVNDVPDIDTASAIRFLERCESPIEACNVVSDLSGDQDPITSHVRHIWGITISRLDLCRNLAYGDLRIVESATVKQRMTGAASSPEYIHVIR